MSQPVILCTNDDGILAPGLAALTGALKTLGDVWVIAPDRQQSAVSHCVTLHRPLRVTEYKPQWLMIDGTPADCMMLALRKLLKTRPALIVSGVNMGPNLGDDVAYSGTVAGAYEGMLAGIPSIAVSNASYVPQHLDGSAAAARDIAARVLHSGVPSDVLLNVNVPDVPYGELQGIRITRQGRRKYPEDIVERIDPRGQRYYWIGGADPGHEDETGTDFEAIANCCISVTPLNRDMTHHGALTDLFPATRMPNWA